MIRLSELKLPLSALPTDVRRAADAPAETDADRAPAPHPEAALRQLSADLLAIAPERITTLSVFKRSFDARKPELLAVYIVDVGLDDLALEQRLLAQHAAHPHIHATPDMTWQPPCQAPSDWPRTGVERPVVIGFGPCGILAALTLARMGLRPIVLERGQPVRDRTQDTWGLWRRQVLKTESNVQFGEGGAGLFSDGKLYSQIKDPRFLGREVMRTFVAAGAPPEILYQAHPHIGTFKLVKVVEQLRQQIQALGGEIHFGQRVTGLRTTTGPDGLATLQAVCSHHAASGTDTEWPTQHAILALGHSARDTFAMLHDAGVFMEAKPFSIGVRIEHPQRVIDQARWGRHAGHPLLGAADYKLVHHASNGRAVYSFCMCPGGTVVAATSEEGRVVTNGMSQYSRNERNANAALVVSIEPSDFPLEQSLWQEAFGTEEGARRHADALAFQAQGQVHPLAGVVLQRHLERRAFEAGGASYLAPAQQVGDFLSGQPSQQLGDVQPSYRPGVQPGDLSTVLPSYAVEALREALPVFGRKIRGFDRPDALMTGVETRTSSPLRITRGDDGQSLNTRGLYPSGEGAGYAGGILSAGVDGIRTAEALGCALLGA